MLKPNRASDYRLWLPWPPSNNGLFRNGTGHGRQQMRFKTKAYKTWKEDADVRIIDACLPRFKTLVMLEIELVAPDTRSRDASNYTKAIEDALVEARVLVDDSQNYVDGIYPHWSHTSDTPGAVVTIHPQPMELVPATVERKPMLTPHERRVLAKLRARGYVLYKPDAHIPEAIQSLVKKGYAELMRGILEDQPQGVRPL